jgi:hypothetical protein
MFYNRSGRWTEMRAFSGLRWKTHVLDGASEIAKKRNCSESSGQRDLTGGSICTRDCRWVCPAALVCEKCSYFGLRRVSEAVLAIRSTGGAGRGWGTVHEMAAKKSLTTVRHASRGPFDAGRGA